MILGVMESGFLSEFSGGEANSSSLLISHLLFTDDILIFCGANSDQIHTLRAPLLYFETILRLKVNLAKSEIIPMRNVLNVESVAKILDCKISQLPMKYLGLPLGVPFRSKSI